MHVIDAVVESSPIYFDPTGTLLSRRSIPSFLFMAGLSLRGMRDRRKKKEELRRLVTAIATTHNIIRAGEELIPI
jgi:hypothetical protein